MNVPHISRRQWAESLLTAGWRALQFSALAGVLSTVRFFVPKVLYEPPTRFAAGTPDDYAMGAVSDRFEETRSIWIVRDGEGVFALVARCTHLGCRPAWSPQQARFLCPCHGSNFGPDGVVIRGPAPKPLRRAAITLADDGTIYIDSAHLADYSVALRRDGFRITEQRIAQVRAVTSHKQA